MDARFRGHEREWIGHRSLTMFRADVVDFATRAASLLARPHT
jgi:hypothetical protein